MVFLYGLGLGVVWFWLRAKGLANGSKGFTVDAKVPDTANASLNDRPLIPSPPKMAVYDLEEIPESFLNHKSLHYIIIIILGLAMTKSVIPS